MDFEIDAWEADTATNDLNSSLFHTPSLSEKSPKKRKGSDQSNSSAKKKKKTKTPATELVNSSESPIKKKAKKIRGKNILKNGCNGDPSSATKAKIVKDNTKETQISQENVLPKKSKKNKFKNPDWKSKSEKKVFVQEEIVQQSTVKVKSISAKNAKKSKQSNEASKKNSDANETGTIQEGGGKKDNSVGKTDKVKKRKKLNDKEQEKKPIPKKKVKKINGEVKSETRSDSDSDDEALEFDSEGELGDYEGSELEIGSDELLSGSDSDVEDMGSLLLQLKKVRRGIVEVKEQEDSDSNESELSQTKVKKSKKKKSIKGKAEDNKQNKSDSDEEESDGDEFLKPKKKSKLKNSEPQQPKKKSKLKNSEPQQPPETIKKLPFNVDKLKSILGATERKDPKDKAERETDSSSDSSESDREETRPPKTATSKGERPKDTSKEKMKKSSLADRMKQQLKAARFRYLNQQLYTSTGKEAFDILSADKEAFQVYHEGFEGQVAHWPQNPVNRVIKHIKKRPKSLVVADFGCGDAKVAQNVPNKVHSFDLVALNEHVTVCNIEKVPLEAESVDIGIFCLSLMGTNLSKFLMEANRVMNTGGTLLVAEVVSRFEKIGSFVKKLDKMGFSLKSKDLSNKMFIWFEFTKTGDCTEESTPEIKLMPCVYKRR